MNTVTSYDDSDRGAIWKNERKERVTQPDFTGSATIDGAAYWVSAWKREPGANPAAPALRFSFKRKQPEAPTSAAASLAAQAPSASDFNDDIPF